MSVDESGGIADDAALYENLPEVEQRQKRGASVADGGGIAADASQFEDLIDETTGKARTLDSDWLYKLGDHVFGPVKARELLEMLYSGQVLADTPIACGESEFMPLKHYGVFRIHLPKATAHQREVAEAKERERAVVRGRLRRRLFLTALAIGVAAAGTFGVIRFIRQSREEAAAKEKLEKETALKKQLEDLLASVSIEPPLMPLVDEAEEEAAHAKSGGHKKSRKKGKQAFARVSGGEGLTGELTQSEIMEGVGRVFGGFKRCIVEQIQRDSESISEQILLTFTINNQGVPENISLGDRALRKTPLRDCMAGQLSTVRWRTYKGEVRNVEYPISIGR